MTTTATSVPATAPRPRFRDLAAAEWIKLTSLRSTWIAYGATALAVVGFNAGTAYDTYSHWAEQGAEGRAGFVRDGVPLLDAFTANAAMVMLLALGVLGALVMVGEYASGTVRTTFAAVPDRRAVMAAKAVVVALAATVFGGLVATVSFALTQAILDGRGVGVPIDHPGALRVVVASALLAPVGALTGLALGTLVRQTAATMAACVAVLLVLPLVATDGRYWSAVVAHALPFEAWNRLVTVAPAPTDFPWTTGGAWTVYGAWALAAAALAVFGTHRRDQ
ncbi:ABC transporter permease [Streptomyces sp. WG5]|uniref:ABC transporter permease n=1 Tax=Streptomyces sp. WG5 TaxID=3417648 RepID=UPI003CE770FF